MKVSLKRNKKINGPKNNIDKIRKIVNFFYTKLTIRRKVLLLLQYNTKNPLLL